MADAAHQRWATSRSPTVGEVWGGALQGERVRPVGLRIGWRWRWQWRWRWHGCQGGSLSHALKQRSSPGRSGRGGFAGLHSPDGESPPAGPAPLSSPSSWPIIVGPSPSPNPNDPNNFSPAPAAPAAPVLNNHYDTKENTKNSTNLLKTSWALHQQLPVSLTKPHAVGAPAGSGVWGRRWTAA